ncbi:hypothetical protein DFP93_11464 [Aneurinibacillus soli]|uniref:Uncharacterized protein n=1 Tax=Aneurinibacillus soli TaxID=1500254 RepID=A0A0U5BE36_9BACL|nr:hypothetical protein [Aneurinibacillus soli]PYE60129.1 hypothetical protein DFP93_11464 [Aneurinibacillus soli]BAU26382.1 hypothetical protein CB4_00509 [Aneurinibacillus soli]
MTSQNKRKRPISPFIQERSRHLHAFLQALCISERETLWFRLIDDNSSPLSKKVAINLSRPYKDIEKSVLQVRFTNSRNTLINPYQSNIKGYGVHMVINGGGTKKESIRRIRAQFIDVDLNKRTAQASSREEADVIAEAFQHDEKDPVTDVSCRESGGLFHLTGIRTESHVQHLKQQFLHQHMPDLTDAMIVETLNGYHIYWPIRNGDVKQFSPIQQALSHKFQSDPNIWNLSRTMRIPGYYHMKNPYRPFMLQIIQPGRATPFTQNELIDRLALTLES